MISIEDKGSGNIIKVPQEFETCNFYLRIDGNNNHVEFAVPISTNPHAQIEIHLMGNGNSIVVGSIYAYELKVHAIDELSLRIGDGTNMNGAYIATNEASSVSIGEKCLLARDVRIYPTDFHKIFSNGSRINGPRPIVIGDNVWLGESVKILKGATIQSGSVIGLGSIVSGNVPSRVVAVGTPVRVVHEDIDWEM